MALRRRKMVIAAALLLMTLIFGVMATITSQLTLKSSIVTESVNVKVSQLEVVDGVEKPIKTKVIMPNQAVSYIPRVTNLRGNSYIRVKLNIIMNKAISKPITADNVYGIGKDWIRKGNYFYCTKKFTNDMSSDPFKGIHIPAEWKQDTASGFTTHVTAECVQSDGFTPDFNSSQPWGAVKIESAKEQDGVIYGKAKKAKNFNSNIVYTSAGKLESKTTNLFKDVVFYPDEKAYKGTLNISNQSDETIDLAFRTQNEETALLKKMKLDIKSEGNIHYAGNLLSSALTEYRYIKALAPGETTELEFSIYFPKDSGNAYSAIKNDLIWQFAATENGTHNPNGSDSGNEPTGMHLPWYLIIACLCAVVSVTYISRNRYYILKKIINRNRKTGFQRR